MIYGFSKYLSTNDAKKYKSFFENLLVYITDVVQVCYLNHTRTIISKVLSSKFLRRWETHHIYLNDDCISSKTVSSEFGFL